MANIRDLAVGEVLTAPSPATTGTSFVLNGQGVDMPTTTPFKLLVFPTGGIPTKYNSELVSVTNRSGDTLTIVRAQGETTAQPIAAGWLVANPILTDDIFNSSTVTNEVPVGSINGTNTTFTLASQPATGSVRLFLNGSRFKSTDDYTVSGNTITFSTAPPTGSNLLVDYMVGTQANSVGTNSYIAKEAVTGSINGSNTVFTTARAYIAGSLQVFVNGLMQSQTQVTETSPSVGTFTLDAAPATGDVIHVAYQYNLNPSGNADTVDGIHASSTPTAGQLLPLDSNAKFSAALITNPYRFSVSRNAAWTPTAGTNNTIPFDTVDYDINSNWNSSTYRYTAPITGLYEFKGNISAASASGTAFACLFKNGVEIRRGTRDGNNNNNYHSLNVDAPLVAGDYVEMRLYVSTGSIEAGVTINYFQGRLVAT